MREESNTAHTADTANIVIRPKACRRRRSRRHNEAEQSAVVGPKDRRLCLTMLNCSAV